MKVTAARALGTVVPAIAVAALVGLQPWSTAAAQTPPVSVAIAPAGAATVPSAPVVEPAAIDFLRGMSRTIAAARSFSVDFRELREVRTTQGQMLTLVSRGTVLLQRPDKLRIEAVLGAADTLMIYDGARFTVVDKPKNLYATADAPDTLDAMLDGIGRKHGIQPAMADLLFADPYAALGTGGITNAYLAGETMLAGVKATQAVFAAPGIEFQLWIDPATSLPLLMTQTYLRGSRPVNTQIEFSNWTLPATPAPDAFAFAPPQGATKIEMLLAR